MMLRCSCGIVTDPCPQLPSVRDCGPGYALDMCSGIIGGTVSLLAASGLSRKKKLGQRVHGWQNSFTLNAYAAMYYVLRMYVSKSSNPRSTAAATRNCPVDLVVVATQLSYTCSPIVISDLYLWFQKKFYAHSWLHRVQQPNRIQAILTSPIRIKVICIKKS